jgi:hypothetical protein
VAHALKIGKWALALMFIFALAAAEARSNFGVGY